MNKEDILKVAPHYVAMMVLILVAFNALRLAYGELSIWIELAIAFAIVFAYRPAVKYIGIAPDPWKD